MCTRRCESHTDALNMQEIYTLKNKCLALLFGNLFYMVSKQLVLCFVETDTERCDMA